MRIFYSTLALIFILAVPASAQFGFEAGLNMANLSLKNAGLKQATKYKAGVAMGIVGGMPLDQNDHVYFEPGFFFAQNGAKIPGPPNGSYTLNVINVPLNIEYKWGTRCGKRFFLGGGPYIGDVLSGSYSYDAYGILPAVSTTLAVSPAANYNIKKWELGAGLNFGYLGKRHLYFRAHYQFGFTNMYPNGDGNNSLKESAFGLTIGYMIRGCNRGNKSGSFGNRSNGHWRGIKKNKWSTHSFYRRPNGPGL